MISLLLKDYFDQAGFISLLDL